jgi:hypothetical protein
LPRIYLYKKHSDIHFDALVPRCDASIQIQYESDSSSSSAISPRGATGAEVNSVVLRDWSFEKLPEASNSKHLGFRIFGKLVYHSHHSHVDASRFGEFWYTTEIQDIHSNGVVISGNGSLYRLEGPAAPEQHAAEPRLAAIMQPFFKLTWPLNARSLLDQVSIFFRSNEQQQQLVDTRRLQGGLRWCMVVYGGVWWCMVVCGGVWWCMVVYGGLRWCMVVHGGVWWCKVVYGGVWWFAVVYGGVRWCKIVHINFLIGRTQRAALQECSVAKCPSANPAGAAAAAAAAATALAATKKTR